jgi:diguanylate cyclase (GGDEF)-like protein/PAS domain S-box-containing protein
MVELTQHTLVVTNAVDLPEALAVVRRNTPEKRFIITKLSNLREVLDICQKEFFDVILIEIDWEDDREKVYLKEKIQTIETPIIIVGNNGDREAALEFLSMGAQDYLNKIEASADSLILAIDKAIARRKFSARIDRENLVRERSVVQKINISSPQEHEERLRIAADNTPISIWSAGIEGNCTFLNRTWLNFTGRTLAEELGNGWLTGIHPEDRAGFLKNYQAAFERRERFQQEYRFLRRDGEYCWVINIGIPRFTNEGEFTGYIGSCTDISDRKQAEEILAQQAQRERLLSQIVQHIHKSLELEHILTAAVEEINNFLCVERIVIFKLDEQQNSRLFYETVMPGLATNWELTTGSQQELKEILDRFKQFKRGQILAIDDLQKDRFGKEYTDLQKDLGVRSLLMVPLILQDRLWGCLCAQQRSKVRQWQLFEIDLMQQLAVQLSIAIQQSELYEQLTDANRALESLATIDALTGISNRRRFDEFLQNEWQRLAREKQYLSLILCDIDFFKQYNDTYGHTVGDRCLQAVAQAINQVIKRPADLAARYGGEEIVVVLPHTPPEGAYKVAQQMANAVRELKIEHRTSNVSPYITLSLGVAGCIPDYNTSPTTLVERADTALYRAKEKGRDRACAFELN